MQRQSYVAVLELVRIQCIFRCVTFWEFGTMMSPNCSHIPNSRWITERWYLKPKHFSDGGDFRMSCNQPDTRLDWITDNHNIPNNDPQNVHELLYWLKKIFSCWKFCGIPLNINYFWIQLVNSTEESEVIIKCLIQSFLGELSALNSHSFNLCIHFNVYCLMAISVESTMEKAGAIIKSLKRKWTSCVRKR